MKKRPITCYQCKQVMIDKPEEQTNWKEGYAICDSCFIYNKVQKEHKAKVLKRSFIYTLAFVVGIGIVGWSILGNAIMVYLMSFDEVIFLLSVSPTENWKVTPILFVLNLAISFAMATLLIVNYVDKMKKLK